MTRRLCLADWQRLEVEFANRCSDNAGNAESGASCKI
jgi:hypothetical protein